MTPIRPDNTKVPSKSPFSQNTSTKMKSGLLPIKPGIIFFLLNFVYHFVIYFMYAFINYHVSRSEKANCSIWIYWIIVCWEAQIRIKTYTARWDYEQITIIWKKLSYFCLWLFLKVVILLKRIQILLCGAKLLFMEDPLLQSTNWTYKISYIWI